MSEPPKTLDIRFGAGNQVIVTDPRLSLADITAYKHDRDLFGGMFPALPEAQREAAWRVWEIWPAENSEDPAKPRASIGVWHGIVLCMADDRPPIIIAADGAMAELAGTWPPPPRPTDAPEYDPTLAEDQAAPIDFTPPR